MTSKPHPTAARTPFRIIYPHSETCPQLGWMVEPTDYMLDTDRLEVVCDHFGCDGEAIVNLPALLADLAAVRSTATDLAEENRKLRSTLAAERSEIERLTALATTGWRLLFGAWAGNGAGEAVAWDFIHEQLKRLDVYVLMFAAGLLDANKDQTDG